MLVVALEANRKGSLKKRIGILVRGILDLVYPPDPEPRELRRIQMPYCQLCGEPVAGVLDAAYECSNCAGRRWHIRRARACYRAEGDVLDWIHHCKYGSQWHRLPQLASWLVEGFEQHYASDGVDVLVPVPLHWTRFWRRGFNQSRELARMLSKQTGVPVRDLLIRRKATRVQASLSRSERLRNCRAAFAPAKRAFDVTGLRLLIIDDVFTTGSTVNACARILRRQGAADVAVLTVARGGSQ